MGKFKTKPALARTAPGILSGKRAMQLIPSLGALRAFDRAGRHLNFTRAGEELNVTQAAISYRVKILESQLGVRLFHRKGRSVTLTEAGETYLAVVHDALQRLERGTATVQASDGMRATGMSRARASAKSTPTTCAP